MRCGHLETMSVDWLAVWGQLLWSEHPGFGAKRSKQSFHKFDFNQT